MAAVKKRRAPKRRLGTKRRGVGGLLGRTRRRRRLSGVGTWKGHRRAHSLASKKGWRKRRRRLGALPEEQFFGGLKRRKKTRRSKSRRKGMGATHRRKKARKGRKGRRKGMGAVHRRKARKSRKSRKSRKGMGAARKRSHRKGRKGSRRGGRLGYMRTQYAAGRFGIDGMGYMKTAYAAGRFGIDGARRRGRRLGYAVERYKMGQLPGEGAELYGYRGRRTSVLGRRFGARRMHGIYGNPAGETFGVGAFKWLFSMKSVAALGGLTLGRTLSNTISHLMHYFLTPSGKTEPMIPVMAINHIADLVGMVGGYEVGKLVGGKTQGQAVGQFAALGSIGGQLFQYLAMGTNAVLGWVGLSTKGADGKAIPYKYGGLGRYGSESEERAIGRYGSESEERAIGRYGSESEERAIGRVRPLPEEEQSEKAIVSEDEPECPADDEPEEEFMGGTPEEEFMGMADTPF